LTVDLQARSQANPECHRRRYPMNNNIRSSEINNPICEFVGCYSEATNKIAVKVGSKGTIFLFLCDNCKPKFCTDQADYRQSNLEVSSH
jgi:hypothetical protein